MIWYFSRALGVIGLLAAVLRVAIAVILGDPAPEVLGAVGTGILLLVGGLLAGAVVDVGVEIRKRSRSGEPRRVRRFRKR